MRGKVMHQCFIFCRIGITPAYAGKRCNHWCKGSRMKDHPRLCGEKVVSSSMVTSVTGSPPPMRGKAKHSGSGDAKARITPAYAGKSPNAWNALTLTLGSPPPMRGKGLAWFFRLCSGRITPAYAGKSLQSRFCSAKFWDHPRLCGEKALRSVAWKDPVGSPPPMRGKVFVVWA